MPELERYADTVDYWLRRALERRRYLTVILYSVVLQTISILLTLKRAVISPVMRQIERWRIACEHMSCPYCKNGRGHELTFSVIKPFEYLPDEPKELWLGEEAPLELTQGNLLQNTAPIQLFAANLFWTEQDTARLRAFQQYTLQR